MRASKRKSSVDLQEAPRRVVEMRGLAAADPVRNLVVEKFIREYG